jgi:hypothetical protein
MTVTCSRYDMAEILLIWLTRMYVNAGQMLLEHEKSQMMRRHVICILMAFLVYYF